MLGPSASSAHALRVAQGRAALGLLASVEFDIVDLVMARLRAASVPLATLRRHRPAAPAGGHPARRAQGRACLRLVTKKAVPLDIVDCVLRHLRVLPLPLAVVADHARRMRARSLTVVVVGRRPGE